MNMYSIWKYPVEPDFVNQVFEMPIGAEIISFGLDGEDRLCFWAIVNTDAPLEARIIACVGTGWPIDNIFNERTSKYVNFIGTATHTPYVWHLFELGADIKNLEVATESSREAADAQSN